MAQPRPLTSGERALLLRVADLVPQHAEVLRAQLAVAEHAGRSHSGADECFDLSVPGEVPLFSSPSSGPLLGVNVVENDEPIGMIDLRVADGRLSSFEYSWTTGEPPHELPEPGQLRAPGDVPHKKPARFTSVEQRIDEWAHRRLDGVPERGAKSWLIEFLVFGLKQAWACVFGAALLLVLFVTRLWYPDDAALARNDFLVIAAVAIQVLMVVFRLETLGELRVIILFHIVGTGMELFKTDVGSWSYEGGGILHLGAVPLYSGFMYAAVGSYMVRVYRLFDLRFDRYPKRWITAIIAALIYVNFFTHHFTFDARWILLAAIVVVYARCVMHVRIFRARIRMPILVAFLLVALFIWIAENIATWSNAWIYPNQEDGWQLVSLTKLVSWFLLMMISVVLVAWVYPPRPLDRVGGSRQSD